MNKDRASRHAYRIPLRYSNERADGGGKTSVTSYHQLDVFVLSIEHYVFEIVERGKISFQVVLKKFKVGLNHPIKMNKSH